MLSRVLISQKIA